MKRNITRPAIYFIGSLSLLAFAATIISSTNSPKWIATDDGDGIVLVKNQNGPTLGYSSKSGVKILTVDGLAFKDLNKNGKLDKYEDWRLPVSERAKDLASKLSVEQIAGLMLYSAHQAIPALSGPFGAGTYGGKHFSDGGIDAAEVTDQQRDFLIKDNLRHVLVTSVQTP